MPHIRAAQKAYLDDRGVDSAALELSPFGNLQRYFASKTSGWDQTRLRMDEMLDQTQQFESFARTLSRAIDIKASVSEGVAVPSGNAATPATDPTAIDAADMQNLAAVLASTPSDSPFDRLERARSFFTSYVLTLLRLYRTDARVVSVNVLDPVATVDAYTKTKVETKPDELAEKAEAAIDNARNRKTKPASVTELEMSRNGLKDKLKEAENVATHASKPLEAAFGSVAATSKDLSAARAALSKTLDDQRANPGSTEGEKKIMQNAVDQARAFLAEKQSLYNAANTELGKHLSARETQGKEVASLRAQIAVIDRAIDDAYWEPARRAAAAAVAAKPEAYGSPEAPRRQVLVMLQIHVEPGNIPDQVAGMEIEIVNGNEKDVAVLFAHPGRVYDTSDQRMLNRVQQAISTTIAAAPGNASAQLAADSRSRDEARGRYLSRLNKTASFVTAGNGIKLKADAPGVASAIVNPCFGWYFYPSNIVVEKNWLGDYTATGYLEAGARDCAVWLSLPSDLENPDLIFKLTPIHGRIDDGDYKRGNLLATVPVKIPKYSKLEHAVGPYIVTSPGPTRVLLSPAGADIADVAPADSGPIGGRNMFAPDK